MMSIGYHIRQANDPLHNISVENLAHRIKKPDQKFIDYIHQLRTVGALDQKAYREMKTRLPYVVAATFQPSYRKIEHFAKTSFFIIDLDHLADKEVDSKLLFAKICNDPRTALCFASPSGDGLKVFLKLEEPFYDAGKYSIFYKLFVGQYANEFAVQQVVDKVTSDVSRACFVSYDPEVYYNANAVGISTSKFIDFDNHLQMNELLSGLQQETNTANPVPPTENIKQDLPSDILQQIRERLNPILKEKRERKIFVPAELEAILPEITAHLLLYDMEIESVKNIHFGKQIKVKMQHWWGEVNIFYGKKGYSVVKSTKSGSSEKLTDIASEVISNLIIQ